MMSNIELSLNKTGSIDVTIFWFWWPSELEPLEGNLQMA